MGYSEGDFRHKRKQIIKNGKREGSAASVKPQIQNSIFKINCRGPMFAGCSLRRTCERTCGRERGPSRGEAAARCALRAQIQNSKFKIQNYKSGSSLRRTQRRKGVAGLRRAEAAARTAFARPISTRGKPAAERRGLHERTCGREHGPPQGRFLPETSPPPGGGCGLQRPKGRNEK